jgi:hypothetical protein
MTKENFLLEFSKTNFDYTISTFMIYKEKNGNGVAAGKMFENIIEWHVNDFVNGWYALKLNLTNSNWCVHDVIVSPNPDIVNNFEEVLKIKLAVEKQESDSTKRLDLLHKLLNLKWGCVIGVSAKTYKDFDGQVTTSHEPRKILDDNKEHVINGTFDLSNFLDKLSNKTNEYQLILGLNTFKNGRYRITNFDLDRVKDIVKFITFKKCRIHTNYYLHDSNMNKIVEFKYGGKTANAYQRGIWVCKKAGKEPFNSLFVFDSILEGSYVYNGDEDAWWAKCKKLFTQPN